MVAALRLVAMGAEREMALRATTEKADAFAVGPRVTSTK